MTDKKSTTHSHESVLRQPTSRHPVELRQEKVREHLIVRPSRDYPTSDHFNGKRFHNLERNPRDLGDVFTWLRTRQPSHWPQWQENHAFPLPIPRYSTRVSDWHATFINHATVLLQIGPYNLITDPVWSERVSPFKMVGPKRVRAPGLSLSDLPPIDVVLLSHNHYDHMDLATLRWLQRRDQPHVVTGLGNAAILHANGITHVTELDWWQSVVHKDLTIHFTPAQHFSGRGLRDRDLTLWGGLWVETEAGSAFFAGDTGYGGHFREIRERLGSPRLALLPIGAYEPRWFMSPVHMNPDDAVRAHVDLMAKQSLAIHFNTFQLTDEPMDQPVKDLAQALAQHHADSERFVVLAEGQGRAF